MSLFDEVENLGQGKPEKVIASKLEIPEEMVKKALKELIPTIAGGLKKNMEQEQGGDSLAAALQRDRHERYLEQPDELTRKQSVDDGNKILGHIFGTKEVSREVAKRTADRTGIDPATLKRLLPIVAALSMGALKRRAGRDGRLAQTASRTASRTASQSKVDAGGPLAAILAGDREPEWFAEVLARHGGRRR